VAFLSDSEAIILMDHRLGNGRLFNHDELCQLRDAGVQTVLSQATDWNEFVHNGHWKAFDWNYFDDYLTRLDKVGLKCILHMWFTQYSHFPPEFYVESQQGIVKGMLSPWHEQAQEINLEVLRTIRDRYASDKVLLASAQAQGGERILLNEAAYYDVNAIEDWESRGCSGLPNHTTEHGQDWLKEAYLKLVMDQQRILIEQPSREIWFMLSWRKMTHLHNMPHGCQFLPDFLEGFKSLNPTAINHISFNYFTYEQAHWDLMKSVREQWGFNEFAGAEYCEGLRDGAPMQGGKHSEPTGRLAVKHGLRGLLVHPCHAFTHHDRLEPWMVQQIKEANQGFKQRGKD
jgi:hypothetical protein